MINLIFYFGGGVWNELVEKPSLSVEETVMKAGNRQR